MLHLVYDKKSYEDLVIDETGQIWFPSMTQCDYNVEKKPRWPEWWGVYKQENSLLKIWAEKVKMTSKGVLFHKTLIPFDCCCRYTGVVDINGKPIYTKDYVKIDELGWIGFVYQERDLKGICVEGIGGFSSCPYLIERLGNPILGDIDEKLKNHLLTVEKDFMIHNSIPLNTSIEYNILGLNLR